MNIRGQCGEQVADETWQLGLVRSTKKEEDGDVAGVAGLRMRDGVIMHRYFYSSFIFGM